MKSLIEFFLRNDKFTVIILLLLVFFGVNGVKRLNSESYPTVDLGVALIITPYPGAGPEDVEADVTRIIEDRVRTIRGIRDVKSVSQIGLSRVVVRADIDHFNINEVMNDVEKAIGSISGLPPGVLEPTYRELNSEEFPAIEIAVTGDNQKRKRDLFAYFLKESIEDVSGVLQVELQGYQEREFSIYLHQDLMRTHHIGANEIVATLRARNVNVPAGDLISDHSQYLVRLDGKAQSVKDLLNTPIRTNFTGQKVLLSDVATVVDGEEDPKILAAVNGKPSTLLIVAKRGGADTITLVKEIEKRISEIQVPDGLSIEVYNNEAAKVKNRTEVLLSNAYVGLFLVIAFMLIFLPGKFGLMASLSLPIALMGTIGFMPSMGMNLNVVTISALVICLGMLVDNSVVISENYVRLRGEGMPAFEAAGKAAQQFWLPITCTAMTTVAAFLPMLVTKGILGQFIKFLPIIVTTALLVSLFESFFLLPLRLFLVDKLRPKNDATIKDSKGWFDVIRSSFEKIMNILIRRRRLVFVVFSAVIVTSLYLLLVVNRFVLFPSEQTEVYLARIEMPKGTPLQETLDATEWLAQEVETQLGDYLAYVVAIAGKSELDLADPKSKNGDNVGIVKVYVTREASFELHYTRALKLMRGIDTSRFLNVAYSTVINGPPVGAPVNISFRSHNSQQLHDMSYQVLERINQVPGIINAEIDDVYGDDEVEIRLDHRRIQRLGLNVAQIGETLKDLLDGRVISELSHDNRKFNIRLRLADQDKMNIDNLRRIQILDQMGNLIPLSRLADFKKRDGAQIIRRFNYQRSKTLTAEIDSQLITSSAANQSVIRTFHELSSQFPQVSMAVGGEEEQSRESMQSLAEAMVLAMLAIFAILVFLFKSYLRPLIIMSTIPLGLTGVAIAFLIHGIPLSFLAVVGIIGLAGIIVNSGIVLISFIDQLRDESQDSLHEILVRASGLRLRAIMVTALTTFSGLIPTAYGIGGADLILMPMTLAMAWGLASGTILTLIWVPCAYMLIEDFINVGRRWFGPQKETSQLVIKKTSELEHTKSAS